MAEDLLRPLSVRDEEEGLFARDIDGQLIRMMPVVAADLVRDITLIIDGQSVTVKKAVPATDSQGNPLFDEAGNARPRPTTIYDAARQLYVKQPGDKNPIPVLCHQEHLDPVGVCRACVVEISKMKRGKITRERKLLPACQHRVEETMEVHTLATPDADARKRVESSVKVLVELLVGDHLGGRSPGETLQKQPYNELAALAVRVGVEESRFPAPAIHRPLDHSSSTIKVDHSACILCDRCARGCTDVRQNLVIGHTGKGYATQIAFDLNNKMSESSCVSCGECVISCPTGALTLDKVVDRTGDDLLQSGAAVTVEELRAVPLFANLPYKFLQWNAQSIRRRKVQPGDVLCREGETGSTAFVLLSGEYEAFLQSPLARVDTRSTSPWRTLLGKLATGLVPRKEPVPGSAEPTGLVRSDGGPPLPLRGSLRLRPPDDLIIGEMTCLNHYPRSATVIVREPGEVLEIGRNVLYVLQRDITARALLDRVYRERALRSHLRQITLFEKLSTEQREESIEFLRTRVELVRVEPGQVIFSQGERADHFYMVRLGFVKVSQKRQSDEIVLNYLGPGSHFGEIGLLTRTAEYWPEQASGGVRAGVRTATCTALDDVELVRIRGEHFEELLASRPELAAAMRGDAARLLARDVQTQQSLGTRLDDFLENGLHNAQKLLVLDLEACTRCDECTKACADTHEGVSRLIREGLRFDKFLVASSCRSCLDPYCLVGCPVDAIHRRPREGDTQSLEIVIEDWCIGCGQCAKNCPYGNINMQSVGSLAAESGQADRQQAVVHRKATTCDLCRHVVGPKEEVSCVYACPHNAAFRMSGPELLEIVARVN